MTETRESMTEWIQVEHPAAVSSERPPDGETADAATLHVVAAPLFDVSIC